MKNTILTLFYISIVAFTLHAEDGKDGVQQDFNFFIQKPEAEQETDEAVLELMEWLVSEEVTIPQQNQHVADFLYAKSIQATCVDTAGSTTRTHNGVAAGLTTLMCVGDTYTIAHNNDAVTTGDGNPATQAGIDLGIFLAPPLSSGCLVSDISGSSTSGMMNTWADLTMMNAPTLVGTDPLGNVSFTHTGTYNTLYNSGSYIQLYFAPVTIDDVTSTPKTLSEDVGGANECVNISTSDVFSIVFLADIDTTNFTTPAGGNLCQATIQIVGGLAEFDASDYTVSIELSTNPAVTGTITSPALKHNSTVIFNVPEPGI